MKVICTNIEKIIDESAINKIENSYNISLPDNFKNFFEKNNGGTPSKNVFKYDDNEYEIRCFLSFNDNQYNSIETPLKSFLEETNGKIIPFAKDSGDNYYCLNIKNNKIYFWDSNDNLYYYIANTFDTFISYII